MGRFSSVQTYSDSNPTVVSVPYSQATGGREAKPGSGATGRVEVEKLRHLTGSAAGASSSLFHEYRKDRRTEMLRLERLQTEAETQERDREFHDRLEAHRREAEERTRRRAEKRKRKRLKGRAARLAAAEGEEDEGEEEEEEEEEEGGGKGGGGGGGGGEKDADEDEEVGEDLLAAVLGEMAAEVLPPTKRCAREEEGTEKDKEKEKEEGGSAEEAEVPKKEAEVPKKEATSETDTRAPSK